MVRLTRIICNIIIVLTTVSCTEVVEPVHLENLSPNSSEQETFEIKVNALTFKVANTLNKAQFNRMISMPGAGFSANVVPETTITSNSLPENTQIHEYKLGVGDEIELIQHVDLEQRVTTPESLGNSSISNLVSTTGRVGTDGAVLLIGVGRLDALDRSIAQLRDEVRSVLIRNGRTPNFQLEIKSYNSQKAFITTADRDLTNNETSVVQITDQGVTLRQTVATSGVTYDQTKLTTVRLLRDGNNYTFTLPDLFSNKIPEIFIVNNDHVFIENYAYRDGKVFLLGGVKPSVINIQPEQRQTLADVLFTPGGPLDKDTAQRSAVYLLRGTDPVNAYHLDSQNPLRVLVADSVELRPNDVIYVGEQPLSTLNRTISQVNPLTILLQKIIATNGP